MDRELRNQARALVAQLHTLGSILGWPELVIKPGVRILAGEDAWTKLLRYPAPGVLEAALEATKSKIEQEYPF